MLSPKRQILLFACCGFFLVPLCTFAQNDCGIFSSNTKNIETSQLASHILTNNYTLNASSLYPQENILVALEHLHYYCCEKGDVQPQHCQNLSLDDAYYAQSFYLFDHLLDIGRRSLDGDPAQQYPEAMLSSHGQEWFQTIKKIAVAVHGAVPGVVIEYYKTFRKPEQHTFAMHLENPQQTVENANFIAGFSKKYTDEAGFGLKNKYLGMCFIAHVLAEDLKGERNTSRRNNKKLLQSCLQRANYRIEDEFNYVKQILIQQGANLVVSSLKNYADAYFVRGRMQDLLQKFGDLQGLFVTVNQKFNQGTKQCVSK